MLRRSLLLLLLMIAPSCCSSSRGGGGVYDSGGLKFTFLGFDLYSRTLRVSPNEQRVEGDIVIEDPGGGVRIQREAFVSGTPLPIVPGSVKPYP